MPKLDLTIPTEVLSEESKPELLRELGAALLHWEGAPDTEFFRSITWAHLHELPWRRSRLLTAPPSRTRCSTSRSPPARSASAARPGIVEDATKLVLDATGWGTEAGVRVWVLIHEVPDGNWGAAGQVVRFEQLREAAKAEREQEGSGKEKVPAAATDGEGVPA